MTTYLLVIFLILLSFALNKIIYKHEITLGESIAIILTPIALLTIFWLISFNSKVRDHLVLNGQVISKEVDRVHCRHSYPCNCRVRCSGSGNHRSCYTRCQTCYRHSYDNDYVVNSTIGKFYIDTIDRQGLKTPPRYSSTNIGDPVSKTSSYDNYIKGSKNTLFKSDYVLSKEELKSLPKYPDSIYDYWKINRVLDLTGKIPADQLREFNEKLSNFLRDQPSQKEHNVVVIYLDKPLSYVNLVVSKWFGGKKNDILIFIGLLDNKIEYVKIQSWSKTSSFDVSLRDGILSSQSALDFDNVIKSLEDSIKEFYFLRNFEEFEYLKFQIIPGTFELICYILLCLICSFVMSYNLGKPQENFYS